MSGTDRAARVRRGYLLAGRATRLPGKFLLPVGGTPIVLRAEAALREAGLEATVVTVGPLALPGVRCLPDPADAGPLGGLETIVAETREPFFLAGADMPFLDPRAIRSLVDAFDGRTVVPVSRDGHWSVLHAIYAGVDARSLRALARTGAGLRDLVQDQLDRGGARLLPPGAVPERSMTDVDTREGYERVAHPARGRTDK